MIQKSPTVFPPKITSHNLIFETEKPSLVSTRKRLSIIVSMHLNYIKLGNTEFCIKLLKMYVREMCLTIKVAEKVKNFRPTLIFFKSIKLHVSSLFTLIIFSYFFCSFSMRLSWIILSWIQISLTLGADILMVCYRTT